MNGILVINKEKDFTSHDVVAVVRKTLNIRKVGHTGTLDPDATGVLPICLGRATKVVEYLSQDDKSYICDMIIGKKTDTADLNGKILETSDNTFTYEEIKKAVESFKGEHMQLPPMYSSIRVNGRRLYEYAREGIKVEREKRPVSIYEIKVLEVNGKNVKFYVSCSKGSYIRTLCEDIAKKIDNYAYMSNLIRTSSGLFTLDDAISLDELKQLKKEDKIESHLHKMSDSLGDFIKLNINKDSKKLLYNGQFLYNEDLIGGYKDYKDNKLFLLYDNDLLVAIYKHGLDKKSNKILRIEKMLVINDA